MVFTVTFILVNASLLNKKKKKLNNYVFYLPGVKSPDNGTHSTGRASSGQSSHSTSNDQHLPIRTAFLKFKLWNKQKNLIWERTNSPNIFIQDLMWEVYGNESSKLK